MPTRSLLSLLLAVALCLLGAVACERPDAPERSLHAVGRAIDAALADLPAPSTVTVPRHPDGAATVEVVWIVAHPYRNEESYTRLGVAIDRPSIARLVDLGNTGPECILVARLEGDRIAEVGHLRCDRTIRLEGDDQMLALRSGDRIVVALGDGGTVTIAREAIGAAPR
jgi:hypothetical protein